MIPAIERLLEPTRGSQPLCRGMTGKSISESGAPLLKWLIMNLSPRYEKRLLYDLE